MRYDGKIGDLIINSVLIKAIHNFNPDIKIYVLTGSTAAKLVKYHPFITETIIYENKKTPVRSLKAKFKSLNIDLVIDFSEFLRFNEIQLLNAVNGKYYVGYNKAGWRIFNQSVPSHANDIHITERYRRMLHLVGIPLNDYSYDIYAPQAELELAEQLPLAPEKIHILFNGFTAMSSKTLSIEKIYSISHDISERFQNAKIYFFAPGDQIHRLQECFAGSDPEKIHIHPAEVSILQLYGIIKKMDHCLSADTATIHLACAARTPLIGLYKNIDQRSSDGVMWLPLHKNHVIVYSESGAAEQVDINNLDNKKILSAVEQLTPNKSKPQ
jgi:ADP-heptose:LPS heptosyltransferase